MQKANAEKIINNFFYEEKLLQSVNSTECLIVAAVAVEQWL